MWKWLLKSLNFNIITKEMWGITTVNTRNCLNFYSWNCSIQGKTSLTSWSYKHFFFFLSFFPFFFKGQKVLGIQACLGSILPSKCIIFENIKNNNNNNNNSKILFYICYKWCMRLTCVALECVAIICGMEMCSYHVINVSF